MNKATVVLAILAIVIVGCAKKTTTVASSGSKVQLQQLIHFDFDKSIIKPEDQSVLKNNAEYMTANPEQKVVIAGHCDERGTAEYNVALGKRRAEAAKDYLVNLGIQDNRLLTETYGKERPICVLPHEECYAKNRRAEFIAK